MTDLSPSDDEFPDLSEVWRRQKQGTVPPKRNSSKRVHPSSTTTEGRHNAEALNTAPTIRLRRLGPVQSQDNPLLSRWRAGHNGVEFVPESHSVPRKLRTRYPSPVCAVSPYRGDSDAEEPSETERTSDQGSELPVEGDTDRGDRSPASDSFARMSPGRLSPATTPDRLRIYKSSETSGSDGKSRTALKGTTPVAASRRGKLGVHSQPRGSEVPGSWSVLGTLHGKLSVSVLCPKSE